MRAALERAARAGDVHTVDEMLGSGIDIDSVNRYGQTALMLAAHNGHLELVRFLLQQGAQRNVTAKYGLSALMLAIVAGHEEVARILVRAGADLTISGTGAPGFFEKRAFDLAAEQGMKDLCDEIAARQHVAV
jgi:uncharacterized protein